MNDTEFIELLNLYLDHEISATDAARLEAEVQNNIERRRIYHQYCRMQKACKLAAADFQTDPVVAGAPPDKKVVAFSPVTGGPASRRKRGSGLYVIGTFAALAACAAVAFVNRPQSTPVSQPTVAVTPPSAAAPTSTIVNPDATFVTSTSAAPRGLVSVPPRPQPIWVRDPLLLTGNTQAEAMRAAAVNQANSQLAWIHTVQLAPVQQRQATDLDFTSTLQQTEGRALGNRSASSPRQPEAAEEMAAFRFAK